MTLFINLFQTVCNQLLLRRQSYRLRDREICFFRSTFGLEDRYYGRMRSSALTTHIPLSAKAGTNFPARGGRSVGIVHSRTQATEFSLPESCGPYSTSISVGCVDLTNGFS
jgi:hypothetical protein